MDDATHDTLHGTWYPGKDGQWPNGTVRVGKMDVTHTSEIDQLRIDLSEARRQLAEARRRLGHEVTRLRLATCECSSRADDDVPLDNDPQHHDFSCPFRTGAPGGLLDPKPKADEEKSKPSAAQKKLWNAESEVVLLRAERNAAREQLAEARKIVWLLIAVVRDVRTNDYPWQNGGKYARLDGWLRKEIER